MTTQQPRDASQAYADNGVLLLKVAQTMAKLGVSALPRNYELFHAALTAKKTDLSREIAALGPMPRQADLDRIGITHRLAVHTALAADTARAEAEDALTTISAALRSARVDHVAFLARLSHFIGVMQSDPVVSLSGFLDEAIEVQRTASHVKAGMHMLDATLAEMATRIGDSRKVLAQSREALLRDPASGLPNRLAFSAQMKTVFEEPAAHGQTALVLAFVEGADGALTDKVLKKIAATFRTCIKKNDFVARIGECDFAFLFHEVSLEAAMAIAHRLRQAVEVVAMGRAADPASARGLSLCAGVSMVSEAPGEDALIARASAALGAARSGGSAVISAASVSSPPAAASPVRPSRLAMR